LTAHDGTLNWLHAQGDGISFRAQRIGTRAVQIHDHTGDRRIGGVQAHAYAANTVGVEGKVFLLCVGKSAGEYKNEAVGIDGRLDGGLYRTRQDHLDRDVGALAPHLQLLDLGRAASRALCRAQRH
jgi:hypothetical protein